MKRILLTAALCLSTAVMGFAQQTASDMPATREDVQKYFEVTHSREMMSQVVDAMSKPMHQMMHEEYLKNQASLPPDFETRMNKMMDDMMKSFPWDAMLQSMVPVYQKHFTKSEIGALTAFYGTPTGQKVLRELPAITAEGMQSMMPLLQKHMDAMKERMQQEVAQMIKDSNRVGDKKSPATPN